MMADVVLDFRTTPPFPVPTETCDYSEWSPTWVLIPCIYMLAFTMGSLGNGLVLWVYLERQPSTIAFRTNVPRSQSRSFTDSLIASLAVADLAFVFTLPLWAAYTALGYHWPFGQLPCKLSSYLVALNMYASVFSLTALSVERYRVVGRRCKGAGRWQARWVVAGVWALAGALALPALVLRTVTMVKEGPGLGEDWQQDTNIGSLQGSQSWSCEMDYSSLISVEMADRKEEVELMWMAAMAIKSTLLGFLLPLAVLLLCYCSLGRLLSQHFGHGPHPDRRNHRRLLRVIVVLVMAFFLCWLPFHTNKTLSLLSELEVLPYSCTFDQILVAAHPYVTCLAYVNSCLNPLLYSCCDSGFRRRCRLLLLGCCWLGRQHPTERNREEPSRSSAVPSVTGN